MAAHEGSPNWYWQKLGYRVERKPTPFGNRRNIFRTDGSELAIEVLPGEHRDDAEVRIARQELQQQQEDSLLPKQLCQQSQLSLVGMAQEG